MLVSLSHENGWVVHPQLLGFCGRLMERKGQENLDIPDTLDQFLNLFTEVLDQRIKQSHPALRQIPPVDQIADFVTFGLVKAVAAPISTTVRGVVIPGVCQSSLIRVVQFLDKHIAERALSFRELYLLGRSQLRFGDDDDLEHESVHLHRIFEDSKWLWRRLANKDLELTELMAGSDPWGNNHTFKAKALCDEFVKVLIAHRRKLYGSKKGKLTESVTEIPKDLLFVYRQPELQLLRECLAMKYPERKWTVIGPSADPKFTLGSYLVITRRLLEIKRKQIAMAKQNPP